MACGSECWGWLDRLKDEPPAFEPRPGTYCHRPCRCKVVCVTYTKCTRMAWTTCPGTVVRSVTVMWGLLLSTRVWVQLRGAWDAANFPPSELKEVEIHLVQRVGAEATACSRMLNQPWRARKHPDEAVARRPHGSSKTPSSRRGCGEAPRSSRSGRHRFSAGWSRGVKKLC